MCTKAPAARAPHAGCAAKKTAVPETAFFVRLQPAVRASLHSKRDSRLIIVAVLQNSIHLGLHNIAAIG